MSEEKDEKKMTVSGFEIPSKRAPLWVRILLMIALLLLAGLGFYITNETTFERVLNR